METNIFKLVGEFIINIPKEQVVWVGKNGKRVKIHEMDNIHLANTYKLLQRNNIIIKHPIRTAYLKVISMEIKDRILKNNWHN